MERIENTLSIKERISGCNTESMAVDYSMRHVVRVPGSLHFKTPFLLFEKE